MCYANDNTNKHRLQIQFKHKVQATIKQQNSLHFQLFGDIR